MALWGYEGTTCVCHEHLRIPYRVMSPAYCAGGLFAAIVEACNFVL